ncbi:peptide deformylase [Candidatus Dojkabacteria bacterium]|nr:peptide deformylase [Candidatus Dojkabacteria bacterium]
MDKVLQIGESNLEKKSKPVKDIRSTDTQKLIDQLLSICQSEEKKTGGLAAPQIGENIQIFVARRADIEDKYLDKDKKVPKEIRENLWEVIINPEVLELGKKKSTYWEGCLSVKNGEVFGPVKRPSMVRIRYKDRTGKEKELTAKNFFAHIVLHELDHLKGILFVKYIDKLTNLWKSRDLDKYLEEYGDFPEVI